MPPLPKGLTMPTARLLEKWNMDLVPPQDGDETWFLDWVLRSPKHSGDHLKVSQNAFQAIRDHYSSDEIETVYEYFGGMGGHALILDDMFKPRVHSVADYSAAAVDHMRRALPEHIRVHQLDAYRPFDFPRADADLVVLDFGDCTVLRSQPGHPQGDLMDRVFLLEPKAVTVTDISARYLHLQKKAYEPLLGEGACDSYEAYLAAYTAHIADRYGYHHIGTSYTRWSAVSAYVPQSADSGESGPILPLPADGVRGLEIL